MHHRLSLSGERFPSRVTGFDGVGLVRPEFVLRGRGENLTVDATREALTDYLRRLVEDAGGATIWYRCADLWSDEANTLVGVEEVLVEENPIIGVRGLRRHLRFPDTFRLEIETLLESIGGATTVHLIFPFVMDGEQFARGAEIARGCGWTNRIGSMVETPSAAIRSTDILAAGATNLLIGLNDLSSLTMATARGLYPAGKLHPAVWDLIEQVKAAVGSVEWGLGGSMTREVYERAAQAGVPYVTLHYAELADLLGVEEHLLPDREFVAGVKAETRRRARESAAR